MLGVLKNISRIIANTPLGRPGIVIVMDFCIVRDESDLNINSRMNIRVLSKYGVWHDLLEIPLNQNDNKQQKYKYQ